METFSLSSRFGTGPDQPDRTGPGRTYCFGEDCDWAERTSVKAGFGSGSAERFCGPQERAEEADVITGSQSESGWEFCSARRRVSWETTWEENSRNPALGSGPHTFTFIDTIILKYWDGFICHTEMKGRRDEVLYFYQSSSLSSCGAQSSCRLGLQVETF